MEADVNLQAGWDLLLIYLISVLYVLLFGELEQCSEPLRHQEHSHIIISIMTFSNSRDRIIGLIDVNIYLSRNCCTRVTTAANHLLSGICVLYRLQLFKEYQAWYRK